MADAAADSYDRDMELAMASSDQSLLYEVNEALHRISDGSYGICEITGKPIETDRLKAFPWTRFSAEAQAVVEQRGAAAGKRLGALGSYSSVGADEDQEEETLEEQEAA